MKRSLFFCGRLQAAFAAVCAAGCLSAAPLSGGRSLSLNFGADRCAVPDGSRPTGLVAVPAGAWVNAAGKAGTLTADRLKQWTGSDIGTFAEDSPLKVAWEASGTWKFAVADSVLHGYLDDDQSSRKKPVSVTVSGIPYRRYSVIVYAATDERHTQAALRPVGINGTYYAGTADGAALFEAGDGTPAADRKTAWGERRAERAAYGITSLRITGLTDPTVTLQGLTGDQYVARGSLAALQIVEEPETVYTAEVNGSAAWDSLVWTASDGSPLPADGCPPPEALRVLRVNAAGGEPPVISVTADMPVFAGLSATAPVVLERSLSADEQHAVLPGIRPTAVFDALPAALPVGRNIVRRLTAEPVTGLKTAPLHGGRSLAVSEDPAQPLNAASLSINFFRPNAAGNIGEVGTLTETLGLWKIPGTDWNDANAAGGRTDGLKWVGADGAVSEEPSGASVSVASSVAWSAVGAADPLQVGYVDEKNGYLKPKTTVAGIPFARYRALIYFSTNTKDTVFAPISVNGTWYCGTPSKNGTAVGGDMWGSTGPDNGSLPAAEGVNVLVTEVLSGDLNLVQMYRKPARCCVSAIQIVACDALHRRTGGTYTVRVGNGGMLDDLAWTPAPGNADLSKSTVRLEADAGPASVQLTRPLKIGRLETAGTAALSVASAAPGGALTAETAVFGTDTEAAAGTLSADKYTIADGAVLTLHEDPAAVGLRAAPTGTLKLAGTSADTPLALRWPGGTNSRFGAVELAEKTALTVTVPGNTVVECVGAGPLVSVLQLTCGGDFGLTSGSHIDRLTLRTDPARLFWIQNTLDSPDVLLDVQAGGIKISGFAPVFGGLKGSGPVTGYRGMTLRTARANGVLAYEGCYAAPGPLTVLGDGRQMLSGTHTSEADLTVGDGTDRPTVMVREFGWAGGIAVAGGATLMGGGRIAKDLTLAAGARLLCSEPFAVTGNLVLPAAEDGTVLLSVSGTAGTEVFSCANAAELDLSRLTGAPTGLVFALDAAKTRVVLADPAAPEPPAGPDFAVPGADGLRPTPEQTAVLTAALDALGADPAGKTVAVTVSANGRPAEAAKTFAAAADALTVFEHVAVLLDTDTGPVLQVAYTFGAERLEAVAGEVTVTAAVGRPAETETLFAGHPAPVFAPGVRILLCDTEGLPLGPETEPAPDTSSAVLRLPSAPRALFRLRAGK